ncbi:hypothetical protein ANN_27579 [Periplaneta americana]|uniref:C2H2-type domain-containing protein n=1 Tax=Periplaneta americana TaxID=6978 RepID=A0ABQ8RW42_PERAM|nr:hypothetical protein ANN_27579 [Periplaneta americana]
MTANNDVMEVEGHNGKQIAMDVIKTEPKVDPLAIQTNDNTDVEQEEKKAVSEEGNLSHLEVSDMKTECGDHNYDIKTEIKVEDSTPVAISFPMVKSEVDNTILRKIFGPIQENETWRILNCRELRDIYKDPDIIALILRWLVHVLWRVPRCKRPLGRPRLRWQDQVYDNLSTVGGRQEDAENRDEDLFDVDRVQQELKAEISSKEDEVFPERIVNNVGKRVSQECARVDRQEYHLTQYGSHNGDNSNISDINHSSIRCNLCNAVFVAPHSVKVHFDIHTDKNSFQCNVCGKYIFKLSDAKKHANLHTGGKPYHCNDCGKSFRKSWNFKIHTRMHAGERPFKCEVCGKCFLQLGILNRHVRIHGGERPFKCEECGICFSEKGHLSRHARTHNGERPFKCNVCFKCFGQSGQLRIHARIHTGERPFKCIMCGKGFSDSGQLYRHARIHTGEKPFKCDACGYDGWINFENETQNRQGWRYAICEREGKDSGFSYYLLDGARTTFRWMVLRDQPGEYCRRNGRTYYEHVVVSAPK